MSDEYRSNNLLIALNEQQTIFFTSTLRFVKCESDLEFFYRSAGGHYPCPPCIRPRTYRRGESPPPWIYHSFSTFQFTNMNINNSTRIFIQFPPPSRIKSLELHIHTIAGNVTSSIRNIPPTNFPTYCNIGPYASCFFLYYLNVRLKVREYFLGRALWLGQDRGRAPQLG